MRWLPLIAMVVGAFALVQGASAQSPRQPTTNMRLLETEVFQRLRIYFPKSDSNRDLATPGTMTARDRRAETERLQFELDTLLATLGAEIDAIRLLLDGQEVAMPKDFGRPYQADVEIRDDGGEVIAGATEDTIIVSTRTIRGFLLGSLLESVRGQGAESRWFRAQTGWRADATSVPAEWLGRFHLLLDALETVEAEDVDPAALEAETSEVLARFEAELESRPTPHPIDPALRRVASGQAKLSTAEAHVLSSAVGQFLLIAEPAEEFLLAHELGHLVLGHYAQGVADVADGSFDDEDCTRGVQRELDADTFAMTLMSYGLTGMTDVILYAQLSEGMSPAEFAEESDAGVLQSAKYGYSHALDYGLAEAGVTNYTSGSCTFPLPEQRVKRARALRAELLDARLRAIAELDTYARQHPAIVAQREADPALSAEQLASWVATHQPECKGVDAKLERRDPIPLLDTPARYIVRCSRPPPDPSAISPAARVLAGRLRYDAFLQTYAAPASN